MDSLLQIGVITTTHGLKGEVKVFPTTDDIQRFLKLDEVILEHRGGQHLLHVQSCRFFKQFAILKFKEFGDINEIEKYKQASLYVTRENAVSLEEDEYFIADLLGLRVLTETGIELGRLKSVISTGANDVYEIELSQGGSVLIPAIKECILDVDMEAGEMIIHLMKGLMAK